MNASPPPVVVEDARVDGVGITQSGPNRLHPGRGDLEIRFAALTYSAPERVQFRYRLEGFDTSWRQADGRSRTTASYTNLPPGHYKFVAIAANNDGVWNSTGISVSFDLAPHYYQTRWFTALCILLAVMAVVVIVHLRSSQMTARARQLEAIVDERTGELTHASEKLSDAHEVLTSQNEELQSMHEELMAQNEELLHSRTLLAEQNEQLEKLATTDGLTGLKNRRTFQEKLEAEFKYSDRYESPLALALLDVDKFKSYNDTFGHLAGDAVLKQVAAILAGCARETDFVARYGGEEFVIILPQTELADAIEVCDRLRAAIENGGWDQRAVTASFGVANITQGASTPSELIANADEALYLSKETGRNRVTGYHPPRAKAVNE